MGSSASGRYAHRVTDLADRPIRPPRPSSRQRFRRRRAVALAVFLVVLVVVAVTVVVGGRAVVSAVRGPGVEDYPGEGQGEVLVQVEPGDSASDIATTLQEADVVKSTSAFTRAATADERSRSVQPGYYRLRAQMSGAAAVGLLLDPAARARNRVTLPEGVTLAVALQRIAESTDLEPAALQEALADPAAIGLPAYAGGQAEGFLFPATYDIEPGTPATEALRLMTSRFAQAAEAVGLEERAAALGRSPYEVLITASLIEKETAFAADRAKVARVVYNRLEAGMPLQFDSTVNYIREEKKARLSVDDLKQESAYNTYQNQGLPPTPIDSPGEAALEAALDPADGDWIYFVTTSTDGSSLFTADYDEFLRAKDKAKAEGVY